MLFRRPMTLQRKFLHGLLILLLVNSTGCASIYNPLAPNWYEKEDDSIVKKCAILNDDRQGYTYPEGINCARQVQNAYLEAGVTDATLSDKFALALIPLSLAAIGIGVAGVDGGNTLLGLALGSGTLLGWGTWMTSETRRELYALGAQAVSCVITASEPLSIPQIRLTNIKNNRATLVDTMSKLDKSIGMVMGDPHAQSEGGKIEATKKIQAARKTLNEGKEAIKAANLATDRLDRAGEIIWNATMDVHSLLVSAQIKNANDLRNFSDFLQGTVYGNFQDILGLAATSTPFGQKKKPDGAAFALQATYNDLIKDLEDAQSKVVKHMVKLDADLQSITIVDLNGSFVNCMNPLKTFQIPKKLLVSPRILQMSPEQEQKIKISRGSPPFSIFGDWPSSVALTISQTTLQGPGVVSINTGGKDDVPANTYRLFVEDAEGNSKIIRIIVSPSPAPPDIPASESDPEKPEVITSLLNALNATKESRPDDKDVSPGVLWEHALDGSDHVIYLSVLGKTNYDDLLTLLREKTPVQNVSYNEPNIELRLTKDELENLKKEMEMEQARPQQVEGAKNPDDLANPTPTILSALNNKSFAVSPEKWQENLKKGSRLPLKNWTIVPHIAKQLLEFSLRFPNGAAARKALDSARAQLLKGNDRIQDVYCRVEGSELILEIPSDQVQNFILGIKEGMWRAR